MWICICDWMQNASGDKQIWLGDEQRSRQDEEKKSKTIWIKPFNQTRPTHKTISICKTHISESVQDLQARIEDKSKLAELYKISNPVAAFCVRVTSRYLKFNFWTKFGSNKNTHGIYSSVRQTCCSSFNYSFATFTFAFTTFEYFKGWQQTSPTLVHGRGQNCQALTW